MTMEFGTMVAEQRKTEVHRALTHAFDMDAYGQLLAQTLDGRQAGQFAMAALEKEREYAGFPSGFAPHLYAQEAYDPQAGIRPTPTELLAAADGVSIYDKREDVHGDVRAFKARGAFLAALAVVTRDSSVRILTTASTGNHARGIIAAVNMLNDALVESGAVRVNEHGDVRAEDANKLFAAHIYTSTTIDNEKRLPLEDGGAYVRSTFASLEDATEQAKLDADANPVAAFIHPFNMPEVIAGQGTLAMELLVDLAAQGIDLRRTPVTLRVAVGGGGMYVGQQVVFDHAMSLGLLHPDSRVIAAEAEQNDSANRSITGQPSLTSQTINPLANGIATLQSSPENVEVIRQHSPGGVRVVSNQYLVMAASELAYAHARGRSGPTAVVPPEFAGAVSLGSLYQEHNEGNTPRGVQVVVTCGGNASPASVVGAAEKYALHDDPTVARAARRLGVTALGVISYNQLEQRRLPVRVEGRDGTDWSASKRTGLWVGASLVGR